VAIGSDAESRIASVSENRNQYDRWFHRSRRGITARCRVIL
jgi:hypothetical protein